MLGAVGLAYFYFTDTLLPPSRAPVPVHQADVPKTTTDLKNLSPALSNQIGRFVTHVEKKDAGYVLTISDYSPVFAYMTRSEREYIQELAQLFPPTVASSTTPSVTVGSTTLTQPQQVPTPASATTTKAVVATTTKKTTATTTPVVPQSKKPQSKASSTPASTGSSSPSTTLEPTTTMMVPETIATNEPYATDITLANQNMRVWVVGDRTIVYAFVGNTTVLIANSKEGILTLKSAILH